MPEKLPERGRIVGMIVPEDQFSASAATKIVARGGKIFRKRVGGPAGIRKPDLTPENTDLDAQLSQVPQPSKSP